VYGIHAVEAALRARRRKLHGLWLREGAPSERLEELHRLARDAALPVEKKPIAELTARCGSDAHQGAVLSAGPLPLLPERESLSVALSPPPLLVALDQVTDPQNLGAIARSAAVFGATGLVLPRHGSAMPTPAASKASAGQLEILPVYEAANLARYLEQAKRAAFWILGAATEGGTDLTTYRRTDAAVLVLGSEERGLRPLVAEACDLLFTIPTSHTGSLNVSAATAIFLYQLRLQSAEKR
jgi:23S rRNA (guanosine2251-2'-O)-methyltransferase